MSGGFAANNAAGFPQRFEHVTVADAGPAEFDVPCLQRFLKAEVTHDSANNRAR